jgi:hypothetical protein
MAFSCTSKLAQTSDATSSHARYNLHVDAMATASLISITYLYHRNCIFKLLQTTIPFKPPNLPNLHNGSPHTHGIPTHLRLFADCAPHILNHTTHAD